jgi:hypothetical protein
LILRRPGEDQDFWKAVRVTAGKMVLMPVNEPHVLKRPTMARAADDDSIGVNARQTPKAKQRFA